MYQPLIADIIAHIEDDELLSELPVLLAALAGHEDVPAAEVEAARAEMLEALALLENV